MTNKKVKTVDEAVKEVVEGKKQNIELQRSIEKEEEGWLIPTGEFKTLYRHDDIAGYSVNDQFVAVMDKQGATFIYMVEQFDRIHHYSV